MNTQALREMTREELVQKHRDLQDELFNLNMRRSLKALDNPLRLRIIRREIAQIATLLREDELNIRSLAQAKKSLLDESEKNSTKKAD